MLAAAGGRPCRRRVARHPLHRLPPVHGAQPGRAARSRGAAPASWPAPRPRGWSPTPGMRLLGDDAVYAATADGDERWQRTQGYLPGLAIAGGTDQVLRNILGERVLGLPPEPRSDKTGAVLGTGSRIVNFDLDDDQRDAAAGAREFFAGRTSPGAARAALEGAARRAGTQGAGRHRVPRHHRARGRRRRRRRACSTSPSSPSRAARCWPGPRWSPPPAPPSCWPTTPELAAPAGRRLGRVRGARRPGDRLGAVDRRRRRHRFPRPRRRRCPGAWARARPPRAGRSTPPAGWPASG